MCLHKLAPVELLTVFVAFVMSFFGDLMLQHEHLYHAVLAIETGQRLANHGADLRGGAGLETSAFANTIRP
jgi:hypothetical protein